MINRRRSFGGTGTENVTAAIKDAEKKIEKEMKTLTKFINYDSDAKV
jgi:hypothetical protein